MPIETQVTIGLFALATVLSIMGWLLVNKDSSQQRNIDDLWRAVQDLREKHDKDAAELQALRLHVAGEHYQKSEMNQKFDKLEESLRQGLKDLGDKFDKLAFAITKSHGGSHGD